MGVLLEELRARSSRDMAIKSWRSSASTINKKKQKMKHFRLNVSCLPRSMSACVFAISLGHAATTDLTSSNARHPLTLNSGQMNIASVGMALRFAISRYARGISYDTAEVPSLISAQSVPFFVAVFLHLTYLSWHRHRVLRIVQALRPRLMAGPLSCKSVIQILQGNLFSRLSTVLNPVADGRAIGQFAFRIPVWMTLIHQTLPSSQYVPLYSAHKEIKK